MRKINLIIHDIRSTYNVGSLLRTAEGLGIEHVYFTGYTPYPKTSNEKRLPHIANKLTSKIHKTALNAENLIAWSYHENIQQLIKHLKDSNCQIIGLEQTPKAINLSNLQPSEFCALILGREVEGLEPNIQEQCDVLVEIPMYGQKESLNVAQAAAIALYTLRET